MGQSTQKCGKSALSFAKAKAKGICNGLQAIEHHRVQSTCAQEFGHKVTKPH